MERNIFAATGPVPSSPSIPGASAQTDVTQPAVTQPIPSTGENAQHVEQKGATLSLPCTAEKPAAGEAASTPSTVGQGMAMEGESASPYSPDNLIHYHTSLGLFECLQKRGVISRDDYRQAVRILTERYGFPENSIFAEGA